MPVAITIFDNQTSEIEIESTDATSQNDDQNQCFDKRC